MSSLDKDWLTRGLIDFEYKKYVLLAYLQSVKMEFGQAKLYPFMSDLVFHYQNLLSIRDNKQLIFEHFPAKISRADFEQLAVTYEKIVKDDSVMQELEEIILYALPQMKSALEEGKNIYEFVEENIEIVPVGMAPLNADAGYLFIGEKSRQETRVYQYQVTIFESAAEKYRGVHTVYKETFRRSFSRTLENVKIELVRKYKDLPNPATYLIESKMIFPFQETLLPIAKRLLVKHISAG